MKKLLSALFVGLTATAFTATAMAAPTQADKHAMPEKQHVMHAPAKHEAAKVAEKHHVAKKPVAHKSNVHHHTTATKKHVVKHDAKKPLPQKTHHVAPKKA